MNHIFVFMNVLVFYIFSSIQSVSALELCVGAKGKRQLSGCKYEFEVYFAGGDCQARTGGHDPRGHVRLKVKDPRHIDGVIRTGDVYVNFNDTVLGITCKNTCATGTGWINGQTHKLTVCNKKSYHH